MSFETMIGLEVHAQLKTNSKLFSPASVLYGQEANTQTHFIDAGFPGTLPVLNRHAVHLAIQFGLAIQANIQNLSYFERKNYVYPDLPKGYQISQLRRPIISQGYIDISVGDQEKRIVIEHAHLEEDAGKSIHDKDPYYSYVDLNRAGTPLLEIVTTPCINSAEEAILYLKTLHQLLRFLDICDGNMQEGSFRCDVNLSIRKKGDLTLGTRTELKNLNSFRFIEKAITVEALRHQNLIESGQPVIQQTRLYCPETNSTVVMREKEEAADYRYFSDPDLLPIQISACDIQHAKNTLAETPDAITIRLRNEDNLESQDIEFLLTSPHHVKFYDTIKSHTHATNKTIIHWLKGNYAALLNEQRLSFEHPPISAKRTAILLDRLTEGVISGKQAKQLFLKLLNSDLDIDNIIEEEGLRLITDSSALESTIHDLLQQYPQQVTEFRNGKEKLMAFFVGKVMQATRGQAEPAEVNALLNRLLKTTP